MSEYMHSAFDGVDVTRIGSERLSLDEFALRLRRHIWAIANAQESLLPLREVFDSGRRVWPAACSEIIQRLTASSEHGRRFHASLENSMNLPLAVVPLRLSLLVTLKNRELQITKLCQLLAVLRDKGKVALSQPAEDRYTILRELDVLIQYSAQAVQQAEELLSRARERERDYSAA